MSSKILSFGFLLLLASTFQSPQGEKQSHTVTEKCPNECSLCKEAIDKALGFLKETQQKDGNWPGCEWSGFGEQKKMGISTQCMAAAACGLAFLAEGSTTTKGKFKENIKKAQEFVRTWVIDGQAKDTGRIGSSPASRNLWSIGMCLLFLCELYRLEKDPKDAEAIKKLVTYFEPLRAKDGHFKQGAAPYENSNKGVSSDVAVAPTNWAILTLSFAKRTSIDGLKIDNDFFEKAFEYYKQCEIKSGGLIYAVKTMAIEGKLQPKMCVSRSICALIALYLIEKQKEDIYKHLADLTKKHMDDLCFFYISNISVFWGAMASHLLGNEEWEKFKKLYIPKILKFQKKNGSFTQLADEPSGLNDYMTKGRRTHTDDIGEPYVTAIFALTMQLSKNHVSFFPGMR